MSGDAKIHAILASSGFSSKLAKMISVEEAGAIWKLSPTAEVVGNPLAQALHGGAVTAFLELACGGVLSHRLEQNRLPQLISINVQFLAPMRLAPVMARPNPRRIGRRVAVAHVDAWQDSPDTIVCAAQCEFLCEFA